MQAVLFITLILGFLTGAHAHELNCASVRRGTFHEMEAAAKAACKHYYSSEREDYSLNLKERLLGVSTGEKHLIQLFTMNCYKIVNPALRSSEVLPSVQEYSSYLLYALCKYPKMRGTIYRGVNYTSDQLAEYNIGSKIKFKSFSSASKSLERAMVFANTAILKIKTRTGRKIHFSSDIPEEKEVLILPNTTFKVIKNKITFVDGRSLSEIELEEI